MSIPSSSSGSGSIPSRIGSLLLHGGQIWTGKGQPLVQALVIKDGMIIDIGTDEMILSKYASIYPKHQQISLSGATVIPGLTDSHLHVIREGMHFNLETRWDGVPTLKQALQMIREAATCTPKGQWIRVVGGWNEHQFAEKRLPTIAELDEAGGEHPVFVLHLYDCALINQIGIKMLGYTAQTPNPPSGEIQRDQQGNPTGILIARPNAFLLYNTLNMLPKLTHEQALNSTLAYIRELHRLGVTSVMDPGGGFQNYPDDYKVIQQLDREEKLTLRIHYSLFPQKPKQELQDFKRWSQMVKPGDGSPFLRHLGAGEMLCFSAADFEDFKEARPDLSHDMESDLDAVVRFLVEINWPFRLHATYGESIERELAVFERIASENPQRFQSLRWFIDHAETITTRDIQRIKALGGGIAIQHRMAFQGEYFQQRYGPAATQHAPPIHAMLSSDIPLGAGTDGTRVATYNPWISLYWLVTGKTTGGLDMSPDTSQQPNRVSREEALHLWTQANSWFTKEDTTRGRLVPGYVGDLTILSTNYFTCFDDDIKHIESIVTIVNGKIVYVHPDATKMGLNGIEPTSVIPAIPEWSPVNVFGGYQNTALTTAWPRRSIPTTVSSYASAESQSPSTHDGAIIGTAPIDPSQFFEHGHDC